MNPAEGNEPLSDDEIVYRRVSDKSGWYEPGSERSVAWEAFKPNRNDATGISVWRAKYLTAGETAARHARLNRYYVLALNVGRLRQIGVEVEPSPYEGGIGHASIVTLNYPAYKNDKNRLREFAEHIATKLVEHVEGPFGPYEVSDSASA